MRVLTVCSAHYGKPGVVVQNQVDALDKPNIKVEFYLIKRKGISGYLWHVIDLKKFLKSNQYDVIHAHYSFCGFVAALSGAKPLIVSLMGGDSQRKVYFPIYKFFHRYFWDQVIVKSEDQLKKIKLKRPVTIIPNGVNISLFPAIDKELACREIGFNPKQINILFLADPSRAEKNVTRAKKSVALLSDSRVVLNVVHDISHRKVNTFLQACDVLLLTSDYEGSPNIIKEGLAAGCKIVATPVGDVPELLESVKGTFISSFNPEDIASKINLAIQYRNKTDGLNRLKQLRLESHQIANRISRLYSEVSTSINK